LPHKFNFGLRYLYIMLGKIFGAGLGWVLTGKFYGIIIGLIIGDFIDKMNKRNTISKKQTSKIDFTQSLIVLSAAIMRANGKIVKSELDYVKTFFVRQFGEEIAKNNLITLREVLKQELDLEEVLAKIRITMRIAEKRLLLQYLFGIAASDGVLDGDELVLLQKITFKLGLSSIDFESNRVLFSARNGGYSYQDYNRGGQQYTSPHTTVQNSDFEVFGLQSTATWEEVKKAYRKMAVQYHPDKVAHLGNEHVKIAEEKFKLIQESYERIKKSKGEK
jgi:DnaJ like chaperone protein